MPLPARLPLALFLILLVAVGGGFLILAETLPVGSDSIGYIYAGEQLAQGNGPTYEDSNNQLAGPFFSMFAFQIRQPDDPRMFLGFPPGLSILLAFGIWLTGNVIAVHYVVPVLSIASLIATFFLARLVSGDEWVGLGASILVALSPAFWQFGTSAWSEVPSMLVVTAGFCCYLWSKQKTQKLWQMLGLSIIGGLLLGYSFFVRYANIFFVPALGLYELFTSKKQIFRQRQQWPFFIIVGLGLLAIPVFNQFYYGGFSLTSYSPAHGWYPQPAFSLSYALGPSFANGRSLVESIKTLWLNFPGLILLVPVGWILLKRPFALLIMIATLGTLGIYSIYAFAPSGINSRFLLPAFPFIGTAVAHAVIRLSKLIPNAKWRLTGGLILLALLSTRVPGYVTELRNRNNNNVNTVRTIQEMVQSSASNAVYLSYAFNDPIIYYGKRSVLNYRRIPVSDPEAGKYHWEMLEPCLVQTVTPLLQNQIPVYYVEDQAPPFADSLAMLQRNFQLELEHESPRVYLITNPISAPTMQGSESCQL